MTGPWLNLIGFVVGVLMWTGGIVTHTRSLRFMGIGFTISNAAFFALLAFVIAGVR
jgi:hypothetical protein